jgi:hypothetical protein
MSKHVFYNLSYLTTMGKTTKKWHKWFLKLLKNDYNQIIFFTTSLIWLNFPCDDDMACHLATSCHKVLWKSMIFCDTLNFCVSWIYAPIFVMACHNFVCAMNVINVNAMGFIILNIHLWLILNLYPTLISISVHF